MNKTFIYIEHSGLGNMVMATPFLRQLKQCYPDSKTVVCCWDRNISAVKGLEYVDNAVIMHPVQVLNAFNNFAEKPTVFISPVGAIWEDSWSGLCEDVVKIPVKTPYMKHESEYKLDLLDAYLNAYPSKCSAGDTFHCTPDFPMALSTTEQSETLTGVEIVARKYAVINASFLKSDHWPMKHWGNLKYSILINCLMHFLSCPIEKFVFVGAAADIDDANDIIKNCDHTDRCINLCGKTTIPQVAIVLKYAKFVVGNDSGLAHVSAALGTRTYTIFKFTSIIKNQPIGIDSTIIAKPCDKRIDCQHGKYKECKNKACCYVTPLEVFDTITGK